MLPMKKLAVDSKIIRLAICLFSIPLLYGCVTTQNQGQNETLRIEVETLNKEVAELKEIISDLEAQQASMGTMVDHLGKRAPADNRKMDQDYYGEAPTPAPSHTVETSSKPAVPENEQELLAQLEPLSAPMLYKKGYNYVTSAEYYKGIAAFNYFLEKYPDHDFADNAHYWSGECYYAVKDYQNALKHFNESAKMNGNKTPDALLKVGYTQAILGDNESAIYSLNLVIEMFPGTRVALLARQKLSQLQ